MTQYNGPQDPGQWGGQPPQTGGPYPPLPPGPAPKQRSWFGRHKIWTGLLGFLAVVVVIAVASNGGGSSTPASSPAATATQEAATHTATQPGQNTAPASAAPVAPKATKAASPAKKSPGIGTPVTSGNLQFTVTKVVRGQAQVGQDFMAQKAQGRYTLVYVTVRNVGNSSETLLDDEQKIKDAQNKTYSPDSMAELALQNNNVWLEQINPGNAVDGVLVYDMPAGVQATAIDFSGGLFKDSKTVQLH